MTSLTKPSSGGAIPHCLAPLPYLFIRPEGLDREWHVQAAFAAAVAAERADDTPRNTSRRIAWLICETGFQLARRGEDRSLLPLGRARLAEALGVGACRVKRTLAMLALSRTLRTEDGAIRVVDWQRLCSAAHYDPARLGVAATPEERTAREADPPQPRPFTAAGDPACFA